MSPTCALAFGDLDGGVWGVGWSPTVGGPMCVGVGRGSAAEVLTAILTGGAEGEEWRVQGDRIELVLSPSRQPAGYAGPDPLDGLDQLCWASGRMALTEGEVEVDAPGWRSGRDGKLELDGIESFRLTAGWFASSDGFALVALRPHGARGQDADLMAASVLEPERAQRVDDPRLSTSYTSAGAPIRAGLELWLAEQDAEDPQAEGQRELPLRRAAGEATAPGLEWEAAGFALQAVPLRWHSRGQDGAGVYLLGRRA